MKCWVCNEELVWGGDHDLEEDETHFGGHTMITNLSCPKCEAYVEVYHGKDLDNDQFFYQILLDLWTYLCYNKL